VIAILAGATVVITTVCAISKCMMHHVTEKSALRRERQKADLALRELLVERRTAAGEKLDPEELQALVASEPEADNLDTELAKRFGRLDAPAELIEQTLARAMAARPANKNRVLAVMDELLEYGANADAILAAVRPLCAGAKERPVPAEHAV
jgi:hypothetical protein